ncbi:hypothetical protein EVAR_62916_1 [Eumeta japonica]|uniref:Uncharacterized protein n=1 Tax=Eumeta variegata TaxID=151549 RepID=A0A4C1ZU06_EUMVA|nr:hypothetical protein EVAR_62916_1 [Eumeta japonica]
MAPGRRRPNSDLEFRKFNMASFSGPSVDGQDIELVYLFSSINVSGIINLDSLNIIGTRTVVTVFDVASDADIRRTKPSMAALGVGDGLAPEGASQTKKFCLQVIKKRPRKKFCLQVIKKRPRKPDVADVHEWCSAATANGSHELDVAAAERPPPGDRRLEGRSWVTVD